MRIIDNNIISCIIIAMVVSYSYTQYYIIINFVVELFKMINYADQWWLAVGKKSREE